MAKLFPQLLARVNGNKKHIERQKKIFVQAQTKDDVGPNLSSSDYNYGNLGKENDQKEFEFLYECTHYNIGSGGMIDELWFPYKTVPDAGGSYPANTNTVKSPNYPASQKHPDAAPAKHFGSSPFALYALLHLDTVSSFNTSCDTLNYLASRYPEEDNGYFVANSPNKHRVPLKYLKSVLEAEQGGSSPQEMKYMFDRAWSLYNEETACYDNTNVVELKKQAAEFVKYHKTVDRYKDVSNFLDEAFGKSAPQDPYTINKLTRHELSWDETEEQARKGSASPPQRELDLKLCLSVVPKFECDFPNLFSMQNTFRDRLRALFPNHNKIFHLLPFLHLKLQILVCCAHRIKNPNCADLSR
jgi:hypothetical protein